jgi:hypothetical protein
MPDATDDKIMELEIMMRLIDIGGSPSSLGSAGSSLSHTIFLNWMHSSVMQQILWVDLAVDGVSR